MTVDGFERIGAYRIEASLGRGGMGEVFLAWDERLGRHVAIKRIRPDKLGDEQQRSRFRREARSVARLNHPAIVQIFDILEQADGDCIVMERVEGRSLLQLLARGPLDLSTVQRLGREIADGLAEAHAKGVVHRDLKPENVLLTASGHAKILDFGLARTLTDDAGEDPEGALTASGVVLGTAYAMSPEQARGLEVDPRSDLFALGSLLYQMLAGEAPFRGPTLLDSLQRVVSFDPPSLAEKRVDVPPALADLVGRLLAKDPAQRPQSARLVVAELDRLTETTGALGGSTGAQAPGRADAETLADARTPTSAPGEGNEVETVLRVLVSTERLGAESIARTLGEARAAELVSRHDREVRDLLAGLGGLEIDKGEGFFCLFERAGDAVAWALRFHRSLEMLEAGAGTELKARAAIHLGEVALRRNSPREVSRGAKPFEVGGPEKSLVARVLRLAEPRQTLLTRAAFDLGRRGGASADPGAADLRWIAHGSYSFTGLDEPLEIFEVGVESKAPLTAPEGGTDARRQVDLGDPAVLGWRPAGGQTVPRRPHWTLDERLGEGGFGEVWRARHKTGEHRVFKFCFEVERLRSLQREVTLFRLLEESLGHREDITRILDWSFEHPPFFLEAEYVAGGSLPQWAAAEGGLDRVPLETRLELVAQVADALHGAHSVGILHKDVKPGNVLIAPEAGGPRARLTDFGIGGLTESGRLGESGITALGFSRSLGSGGSDSGAGTMRYLAPEILEGRPPSVQADLFALGVVLYQMIVADFGRALAPGWRREIDDELLVEDVADCVDGDPELRFASAAELAVRLRSLRTRRQAKDEEAERRKTRERGERRRRLATAGAAFASLLLLLVSIFAWQTLTARDRERLAREEAETRRRQAEGLIDFMLGDLREKLQPIGRLEILGAVGDRAMEYFEESPTEGLSPEETSLRSKALHQIGQVRFGLGQLSAANEAFHGSLEAARRLTEIDPEREDFLFELGQSHFWMGFLHLKLRDLAAAQGHFEAYAEVSKELVRRDPENRDWQLELAYSHSNLGSVLEERGEIGQAGKELEASARVFESLVAAADHDPALVVELAHVYAKLGQILRKRGQLVASQARFQAHLDLLASASENDPQDFRLLGFLGRAHSHLGDLLRLRGMLGEASEHYERGLEINRRRVAHDSENLTWQGELAQMHNKMVRIFCWTGETAAARRHLRAEREIVERLLARAPEHNQWLNARARNLLWWSLLAMENGQIAGAGVDLENASAIFATLAVGSESPTFEYFRILADWLQGEALAAAGDRSAAEEIWKDAGDAISRLSGGTYGPAAIDLRIRLLLARGMEEEAQPAIEELEAIGYREPGYLKTLARYGVQSPTGV